MSTADCPAWVATKGDDMLTVNAPVRIGVTSEMLVGAALLSLVEDGLLSLDDTIDQWHPAIVDGDTLTLRHLLNHTSGLRDYNENQDFLDIATANPGHVWTPEELIQYALDAGQAAPPGQDWDRKFVDFVLLGTVIEAVTAQAAHVAIRDRVVDPLGLSGTFLGGHEGDVATLIPGYLTNGSEVSQWVDSSFWWVGAAYVGNGTDLLALTRDLVTGDLLTEESRQQLVSLSAPTDWAGVTNGLGVLVDVSFGDVRIGQEGELPGYEVRNYFSRELDAAVVIIGTNDWPTFDLFIDAFDVIEASQNL